MPIAPRTYTPHTNILGIRVYALTYQKTMRYIENCIRNRTKTYICVAAVHLIMESQHDKKLREGVNRAGLTTPDGMPLVWILRNRKLETERIYGPELMNRLCRLAENKSYSIFLLGGKLGESAIVANKLKILYPKLHITGYRDTHGKLLSQTEVNDINMVINRKHADIVFVGMGCPYQERWMINNRRRLLAPVLIGVGAAFDFLVGFEHQAPHWIQNIGMEWFFRFMHQPKRLFHRYMIQNVEFFVRMISEGT